MYYIKKWFFRKLYRLLKKSPDQMEMVRYWKSSDRVVAKVTTDKSGATIMKMQGEDYVFPGYPRGHSLFGTLSKLKHEIKNQIFNDNWWALEKGESAENVIARVKKLVTEGVKVRDVSPIGLHTFIEGEDCLERCRYDMIPPEKMVASVREIWRVLDKMETKEPRLRWLKEVLTFIMQEDDAVRFRVQWIVQIMRPRWWKNPVKWLSLALEELGNAEVVGDMKIKVRLLKRIWLTMLADKKIDKLYREFCKEVNWSKVKLSKGDLYHFRGKWFKADFDKFEY